MATYQYIALGPDGRRVTGNMTAASEQAVLTELEKKQLAPVRVQAERGALTISLRKGVGSRKLATFYQQFGDLLRAGVPMLRALRILGRSKSNPKLAGAFAEIAELVEDGEDLSASMRRYPDLFPEVQLAMIQAGEAGGFLEQVLSRLGQFLNHQADLRAKLIGSMIYPIILGTVGTGVLIVIFGFFVPMFRDFFDELPNLPLPTQVILFISALIADYGFFTLIGVGVFVALGWWVVKQPAAQRVWSRVKMKLPITGPLARAVAVARFCRTLGTMLANGIPMLAAMRIAKGSAGNAVLEDAIAKATEAVRSGESLAPPLEETGLFSDDVIEMIRVGESANNLDEVLITIADTVDGRVDRLLTTSVRLAEPLMLLVLGGIIGFVAVGLLIPMIRLSSSI